jgi:hypothetical protein
MAEAAQKPSALDRVMVDIRALDLELHLVELETQGFTTIPGVLSDETIGLAKQAILRRVEKISGRKIDPETATAQDFEGMNYLPYLLPLRLIPWSTVVSTFRRRGYGSHRHTRRCRA